MKILCGAAAVSANRANVSHCSGKGRIILPREPEDLLIVLLQPRFMVTQEKREVYPDAKNGSIICV